MAFEDFRVALALLLDEIAKEPDNVHELQESLREKLTEMRTMGLPLPEDLVELEDYLEEDLEEGVAPGPADPADPSGAQ